MNNFRISFLILLMILLSRNCLWAQINRLSQPWNDSSTAIIIDFYSGNEVDWDQLKTNHQLTAIIHKASQGFNTDKAYAKRREIALQNGYKWGSYHLGTNDDPIQQADHYLKFIGNHPDELMALDLESNDSSKHMNIRNAVLFIQRVYEKTGRYPVVYCNRNMMKEISSYANNDIFKKCNLWYARFRSDIPDFESNVWKQYTLWQFSSEINCKKTGTCLYNVKGTQFDMDVNVYFGTKQQLIDNWPFDRTVD